MEKMKEFIRDISKTGWVVISLVLAIFVLVVIIVLINKKGIDLWPFGNFKNEIENSVLDEELLSNMENTLLNEDEAVLRPSGFSGNYGNDYETATAYVLNTTEVLVATVYKAPNDNSCGSIEFVTVRVPKRSAILNQTLRALFGESVLTDFEPGNIIKTIHKDLVFDNATIENGSARIYTRGSFNEENSCNKNLAIKQIEQTAKQFDAVKEVEIYLNLVKIN
jgi:hypothetical protein